MTSNQFELSESPTDAISSLVFAPNSPSRLLVSSWNRIVYLYDTSKEGAELLRQIDLSAPVLDVCFGRDENEAYAACLDGAVRRLDLESGGIQVLESPHEKGVRSVVYSRENGILLSASWDMTMKVHFPSNPNHTPNTIRLPQKPFSMALTATKLVVAMANRVLHIYDLKALTLLASQSSQEEPNELAVEPWQRRESSLKFMTRAVACMPNDDGYASSSIEGRVAVEWFDASSESQARKYAFKCHRQTQDDVDVVYPVNALAFHPVHGTFVSGGGDGVVALWDAIAKRRIRQYQKFPASVAALAFSNDGKHLAIGVSPGFEDGQEQYNPDVVKVFIKEIGSEAKGKAAK